MNFWLAAASLYQSIDRFLFFLRFFFKESSDFFFLLSLQRVQTMRAEFLRVFK